MQAPPELAMHAVGELAPDFERGRTPLAAGWWRVAFAQGKRLAESRWSLC
jgi:hypothetical protein